MILWTIKKVGSLGFSNMLDIEGREGKDSREPEWITWYTDYVNKLEYDICNDKVASR